VGALTLGEFSWKVENMLNRVLDQTIPPAPAALALVEHAYGTLPGLLAAPRGDGPTPAGVEAIKGVADRIAAGEQAFYEPAAEPEPELASAAGTVVDEPAGAVVEEAAAEAVQPEPADARPRAEVMPIDPVLFEILRAEVAGHLEGIENWLAGCAPEPAPADDPLLRAIITMSGAFAMTEVPTISEVVSPLEGFVKRLLAQGAAPGPDGVALVAEAVAAVRETMAELEAGQRFLPLYERLAEEIAAQRDALPAPAGPSIPVHLDELDDEFLAPQAPEAGAGVAGQEAAGIAAEPGADEAVESTAFAEGEEGFEPEL